MLRKYQQFFASLVWLHDMVGLGVAFAIAHWLRFRVLASDLNALEAETPAFALTMLVAATFVFRALGLYHSHRLTSRLTEIFELAKGVGLSLLVTIAATYFLRDERYSRLTIVLFGALAFLILATTRATARTALATFRSHGFNSRKALVVGDGDAARLVVERFASHPEYGIRVDGVIVRDAWRVGAGVAGASVVGDYSQLAALVRERAVDQVYLALPLDQQTALPGLLEDLQSSTADVKVVPDYVQFMTLHGGIEDLGGMPVVALAHGPIHGWDAVAKRAFDLAFGAVIFVMVLPVLALTALAVKLSSPGPVFYVQERMGLDGRTFRIFKFRSMRVEEPGAACKRTDAADDRTTAVGRLIRKLSIDELPQVLNVLKGDMSLVGPRPDALRFIEEERLMHEIPGYNLRYKVKVGMTGLAQVEGVRGLAPVEKRVERDLYYIRHWSLWLDFKILVRTAFGGFLSKNAY